MFKKFRAGLLLALALMIATVSSAMAAAPDYTTAIVPITDAADGIKAVIIPLATAAIAVAGLVVVIKFGWRFAKGLLVKG